jgi:hypothetical protein
LDTVLARLGEQAAILAEEGRHLIMQYSGVHPANRPDGDLFLISPSGDYFWEPLPAEGKALQSRLLPRFDRFADLVRALSRGLPDESQRRINVPLMEARLALAQDGSTWRKSKEDAAEEYREAIQLSISELGQYAGPVRKDVLLLADTNALLTRPDIESWRVRGSSCITVLLAPVVLSELDRHKVNHRNEAVRDKATKLVRRFGEYRRRGALLDGVTVVTDHVYLRGIAVEPDARHTLPWLDPGNSDDRFLATALEVIREHLATPVAIVTRDINMLNKADFANVPVLDVEDLMPQEEQ